MNFVQMLLTTFLIATIFGADTTFQYHTNETEAPDWNGGWDEYYEKYINPGRRNLGGNPLNVRVSKAMAGKGYDKVRVSVVSSSSTTPSGMAWAYKKKFQYKWTGFHLFSSLVDVTPGETKALTIAGETVNIDIPVQGKGTRGIFFADPCLTQNNWCVWGQQWQTFQVTTSFLNTVMKEPGMDFWYILGDNFYDSSGSQTRDWFSALNLDAKSKVSGMVLGNHDFWVNGSPGSGASYDQLGYGMTQWWAQDTYASYNHDVFDLTTDPSGKQQASPPPLAPENAIWWNQIGNVGMIGYSGAYSWSTYEARFAQACDDFTSAGSIAYLFVLGHWDANGHGCNSGMATDDVADELRKMSNCAAFADKIAYVDGHRHCNEKQNGGYQIGGNGMSGCSQFGHMYVKTSDNGQVEIYYLEFANAAKNNWNSIYSCLQANGIDGCLQYATKWFDSNSPNPSSETCKDRGCTPYNSFYDCQCNPECVQYGSCCADYHDNCADGSPTGTSDTSTPSECGTETWSDVGENCGDCTVLVTNFEAYGYTCDSYCESQGKTCANGWEEVDNSCGKETEFGCSTQIQGSVGLTSDALCQCEGSSSTPDTSTPSGGCGTENWSDVGQNCGDCTVLVNNFGTYGYTCASYCESQGRTCHSGWEEVDNSCGKETHFGCTIQILGSAGLTSDALCQCGEGTSGDASSGDTSSSGPTQDTPAAESSIQCSADVCQWANCHISAPIVCSSGNAQNGCHPDPLFWENTSQCTSFCDTSNCGSSRRLLRH